MIIRRKSPIPPGLYDAVCSSVRDLGEVESNWGPRSMVELTFALAESDANGTPLTMRARYTASTSPKGRLRPTLERWLGRPLTRFEVNRLDLDALLLNRECRLEVVHVKGTKDPDVVFAQVHAIWPATSSNGGPEPDDEVDWPLSKPFLTKDLKDLPPADEDTVPF